MTERFDEILTFGGMSNSLGRTEEVIVEVINNQARLEELYECLFNDDAWVRMRAADALEKVGRSHPTWLIPYVDRFISELHNSNQASILWHLAQIYRQIDLNNEQKTVVIEWLKQLASTTDVDWIVSANVMQTLVDFARSDWCSKKEVEPLIQLQLAHKSKTVSKKAATLLTSLNISPKSS